MQPVGPYRFTEALGVCQVGTAWWAIDGQDRLVTVAVLEGAAASDLPWRQAFANAANAMALTPGGQRYVNADLDAAKPWAAYPAEEGMGAQRLFQTLGMDLHPAEAEAEILVPETGTVAEPPEPVSGVPTSGTTPTSAVPLPWAMHAQAAPPQGQVSSAASGTTAPAPQPVATPTTYGPATTGTPPPDPFSSPVRRIRPSEPSAPRTGLWAALSALLLVAVLAGGAGFWAISAGKPDRPRPAPTGAGPAGPDGTALAPGLMPWAQAAPRSQEERALATVGPSMVFMEAVITGYVRSKQGNALLHPEPVTLSRRCSGVVVNHDGQVLTSTHCVRPTPETLVATALIAVANELVGKGRLKASEVSAFTRARAATAVVTGPQPGTEPEAKLYGQLNTAKGYLTDSPAIPGTVVRSLGVAEGDVTLVKLDQSGLPAAELNPSATITPGTSLLALGYGTTDTNYRTAAYTVLSKPVSVTEVDNQLSVYRISQDVGSYSRGGVAVDLQGRVVGMLDSDPAQPGKGNSLVMPVSTMTGLLDAAGSANALGESDKLYRSGLAAYFAGDHSTAVSRLNQVVQGSPANVLARAYLDAAVFSGGKAESSSSLPGWALALVIAAGVVLVAALALIVVLLVRSRRVGTPRE
ncbi:S1 family peptidase [Micromonospora auratinigra]|uniref:Trypsin-like peptidase domain-containing protein n=1 Tax=Micromonospora auratinigra TaxID=261654 RepID=A0A1A9A954_9ACTN|nr:serine protease [Micromonospora auratinigra]SBT52702.1 Trypsin-like peptidase domain-containing protein [Micromonospora auratinigra]